MEENRTPPEEPKEPDKSSWQARKEGWYDHVPLTVKQLDKIIITCLVLLVLTFVLIYLDAKDIFHLFG